METPQQIAKSLSHQPGVYFFKDEAGGILYVGKAKDLRKRVSQYFDGDLKDTKTTQLVALIRGIDTIETHSEFDALVLEAKLIRAHTPKYNIIAKDDKSPLYLAITFDEELPHIIFVRKSSIEQKKNRLHFGPFQSGRVLRNVLRNIRRILPYCTQNRRTGKPCFYTHLGLCGPCPSAIVGMPESAEKNTLAKKYRANVRKITKIMSGKSLDVLHDLEDEMRELAKAERFEEAQEAKMSVERLGQLLQKHYDPSLYVQGDAFVEDVYEMEMKALQEALLPYYPDLPVPRRIECVDISNTYGTFATGSLVVLSEGKPHKSDYRRFRIRRKQAPNDFAMIAEVVSRRMKHAEWPYPDILVIDGGKGQVRSAMEVLQSHSLPHHVIGLAKRFEEIVVPQGGTCKIVRLPIEHKGLHMLQRIRDESHRFALMYHRLLRKKGFLSDLEAQKV
jgi:excinuclease ABC subunit C